MRAADAQLKTVQKSIDQVRYAAVSLRQTLKELDLSAAQTAKINSGLKQIERAAVSVQGAADKARDALADVKLPASAAADTVANAAIEKRALKELGDQAVDTQAKLERVRARSSLGTFLPGRGAIPLGPAGTRIGPSPTEMGLGQFGPDRGPSNRDIGRILGLGSLPPNPILRDSQLGRGDVRGAERYLRSLGFGIGRGGSGTTGSRGDGGGGGGGGNRGFFSGLLPGGRRAGAGAVTTGIGLGLATVPALGPAAAGLGIAGSTALEGLVGVAGTLKLAFSGITSAAFTTQKAFDALTPVQKSFVQNLRQVDAGLMTHLEGQAQNAVLPGLTSALGAALTPASVNMMTSSVQAFGNAISKAAMAWGKLIGSSQFSNAFGAVMQAAAKGAQQLFTAVSFLFDALVHLQQAAIPLTSWLSSGALAFAKWIDGAVKSAQASGQLAGFFNQAKTALKALGDLVASIGGALHSLVNAFGGFNTAINIIKLLGKVFDTIGSFLNANKKLLTDFFAGAVKAVGDVIKAVGLLGKAITPILKLIDAVAKQIGGWRPVIDAVIAFFVLKIVLSIGWVDKLVTSLLGIAPAAAKGAAGADAALGSVAGAAEGATGAVLALQGALLTMAAIAAAAFAAFEAYKALSYNSGTVVGHAPGKQSIGSTGGGKVIYNKGHYYKMVSAGRGGQAMIQLTPQQVSGMGLGGNPAAQAAAGLLSPNRAAGFQEGAVHHHAATIKVPHFHVYGDPGALQQPKGGGGGGSVPALTTPETALQKAQQAYLAGTAPGTSPQQNLAAAKQYLKTIEELEKKIGALKEHGKKNLTVQRELTALVRDENAALKEILKSEKEIATARLAKKELGILGVGASPNTSTAHLRAQMRTVGGQLKSITGLDDVTIQAEVDKLNKVLKLGIANKDVRQAVSDQLSALKQTIADKLATITDAAKQAVSDASSALSQELGQIHSVADQMFQEQTDAQVKAMTDSLAENLKNLQVMVSSASGNFLFGGSITQTPAELAVTALQRAHDDQQRTLSLTQAQQNLILANATGDPQKIFDAQRQVSDAQYNIQLTGLQDQATAQRTAADQQLQDAKDAYTKQQDALIENYKTQRDIQKTAMDQQIAQYVSDMEKYPADAKYYLGKIEEVWNQNLGPMGSAAFALGGKIYTSFSDALGPLNTLLDDLIKKLAALGALPGGKNALDLLTKNPSGSGGGGSSGGGADRTRMIPMAAGGIVTSPTFALLGEAGPEAVVPLGGGSPGVPLHVTHNIQVVLDKRAIATVVREEFIRLGRSNKSIFSGPGITA